MKKKILFAIIAIILIITVVGVKYAGSTKNRPKIVSTENITKKNLTKSISVTGTIEPNDSQEILLPPSQKILKVYVNENQMVEKEDMLLKLDAADLEYSLKKGQIGLELSKKELEKLQDNENSNTKITLENSIKQAELNLESAEAKYDEARRKQEHNKKLYEAGFLSKEELDNYEIALKDMQNNVENAKIMLQNSQLALKDFLDTEDSIYRQSKQIEIAKTDLESLSKNIANSTIKSNIKGKIIKMDAKPGQYPIQGDMIIIHDLSYYKLTVKVSQYDAVNLKENQESIIKIKGLDKEYKGKVAKIAQTAIIEMTGTNKETKVAIDIILDNPDENIKIGYEADAEIILDKKTNTIAVGFESVQTDIDGKKYVFIAEDNIAKKRYIQTGLESDFDIEIISGLKEGETYITNPPAELKEGDIIVANGGM